MRSPLQRIIPRHKAQQRHFPLCDRLSYYSVSVRILKRILICVFERIRRRIRLGELVFKGIVRFLIERPAETLFVRCRCLRWHGDRGLGLCKLNRREDAIHIEEPQNTQENECYTRNNKDGRLFSNNMGCEYIFGHRRSPRRTTIFQYSEQSLDRKSTRLNSS